MAHKVLRSTYTTDRLCRQFVIGRILSSVGKRTEDEETPGDPNMKKEHLQYLTFSEITILVDYKCVIKTRRKLIACVV